MGQVIPLGRRGARISAAGFSTTGEEENRMDDLCAAGNRVPPSMYIWVSRCQ